MSARTCADCGCSNRLSDAFCYGCGACLEPAAVSRRAITFALAILAAILAAVLIVAF